MPQLIKFGFRNVKSRFVFYSFRETNPIMKPKRELPPYDPRTTEVLRSLQHGQQWCELLIGNGKDYQEFLGMMLLKKFYEGVHRITLRQIAIELACDKHKVTKWLNSIYRDLRDLNDNSPERFIGPGIRHVLDINGYGRDRFWEIWLPQSPRIFERFEFPFIKAAIGWDKFWVDDITHCLYYGEYLVTVKLVVRERNYYRELLMSKAIYHRDISYFAPDEMLDAELDANLQSIKKYPI